MNLHDYSNANGNPKTEAKIYEDNFLNDNPTMEDDYLYAASATDMTGLIPNGGHDDYELENFDEIYPYMPTTALPVPEPPLGEIKFRNELRKNKRGK